MNDNVTLLIVDDLEKNLVAMEALLRGPGLRVLMARSGDEALELLLVNEVALALVDVQMPGMDGFELAELMRGSERTKHVPIVFVTAGAHDRKRQFQGYDSGAVDFLYKPIEPHILTNKVAVFVALFRQKQALARMSVLQSAIVDTMRYPLLVLDAELRVESANQAFYTAFLVPPADTIGRRVYQLGNNQWDIPELRRLLEEILPTNSVFDDFQVTHNFNDIGTRTMLVNARRLHGARSQPRIVLVLADITEQLRLAKNLKDTADELSRSNAELEHFASVASHDLQEPLRMISSYIELLELKYTALFDDRARGYMGHVTSGAQRMAAMIKAILTYSQIGHQAASFTSFEGAVPLQSALANLTNKIQEAEATVTEGPLPRVNADANQLNQLFQNLLGNALKFRSDKRPLVIHVSAIESETEWTFAVADNGIGMDKDGCGRIFQLFQRLNTAQQYPGTGIGLATCRKILEHHRGRIWVESKPDVGSTFYFTLPK